MRTRFALLAIAQGVTPSVAYAQLNLPPPPPPPIGQPTEALPPPAPPQPSPQPPAPPAQPSSQPPASVHRTAPPPSPPPPPPPPPPLSPHHAPHHTVRVYAAPSEEARRPVAVTFNPMPVVLGRVGANLELLIAPHHALVASADVLVAQVNRGGRGSFISEGFGFTTNGSGGAGVEFGYHYWWPRHLALSGMFLGPSLLAGSTTQASVGNPTHAQAYAGAAIDGGAQEVFPSGFTLGGGAGVGVVRMADTTAVFPRLLLQLGWSF